jgi:hypothetical protein
LSSPRYPVSTILRAGGVDPIAACNACGLDDADGVAVRAAPLWLVKAWRGPVVAMTLPWTIYVRPDVLTGDRRRLAHLLIHEMVHVRQWRRLGTIGFAHQYLRGYLSGRRNGLDHYQAYLSISLESEARQIAGH